MGMSLQHSPTRLPRRLPIGARYVVEGYGGGEGKLRVIARYLLLPDGNRINVPGELSRRRLAAGTSGQATLRTRSEPGQNGAPRRTKKNSLPAVELPSDTNVDWMAPGEAPQPLTLNHPASNPGRSSGRGSLLLS